MSWATPPPLLSFTLTGGSSTTVIALHGLGADRQQLLELLHGQDHQVNGGSGGCGVRILAPDLRAHGATALPAQADSLTFDQLAADVENLAADLDLADPVTLVGISMGAAVAVQLLYRRRLPVRAALLIRPAWRWAPNPDNLAVFTDIAALLQTATPAEGKRLLPGMSSYQRIEAVSPAAARALLRQFDDPTAAARASRLIFIPGSAPDQPTPQGHGPVTVLGTAQDPLHPQSLAENLAADLGADWHAVPPRYDAPEAHTDAVRRAYQTMMKDT